MTLHAQPCCWIGYRVDLPPITGIGTSCGGCIRPWIETLPKVIEASSAHPMGPVRTDPSFELRIGIVLEYVITEVHPKEHAMVVIPVRPI